MTVSHYDKDLNVGEAPATLRRSDLVARLAAWERRVRAGRCTICGASAVPGSVHCADHQLPPEHRRAFRPHRG